MFVLGIETTCDETAFSIVRDGNEVLSNVIASQALLHAQFGGVYPEVAARYHLEVCTLVLQEALEKASITPEEIGLIAVATEPGLIGSISIGRNLAATLSFAWNCPLVEVNHVRAHLYAPMISSPRIFPSLGIVLSGGHTFMATMKGIDLYEEIGATVDDAIGEAFDKVASLLGLTYPGGPHIERLAKKGDPLFFSYPPTTIHKKPLSFSFSGLKTQVLYTLKGQNGRKESPSLIEQNQYCHVAASFQHAAFSQVIDRITLALQERNYQALYFGGGVTSNQKLRSMVSSAFPSLPVYWPSQELCLDNGAMIAGLGYWLTLA